MEAVRYDEASIIRGLEQLPTDLRCAFAFFCAARLAPAYQAFHLRTGRGDSAALWSLADRLWADLRGDRMSAEEVKTAIDEGMALVPSEDDEGWDETQPYAEDAAAALVYVFRARLSGDVQEAAWSARCTYETFDHLVQAVAGLDPTTPEAEAAILSHPLLQRELSRQLRDLQELAALRRSDAADATARLEAMLARARSEGDEVFGAMGATPAKT